jgi:hypothetical protein
MIYIIRAEYHLFKNRLTVILPIPTKNLVAAAVEYQFILLYSVKCAGIQPGRKHMIFLWNWSLFCLQKQQEAVPIK